MDCRMRFPSFTIYHGCSAASSCCIRIFSPEQYRSMTISATLRHSLKVGQLGLSFKQFGFHPHIHRFILPFSGSLVTDWLTTFPTCYTPRPVSLSDKSGDDRFFKEHLPNPLPVGYLLSSLYGRTQILDKSRHARLGDSFPCFFEQ